MLKHRLSFGAILIVALLGLVYADDYIEKAVVEGPEFLRHLGMVNCDGIIVAAIIAALVLAGTLELHGLFVAAGQAPLLGWPIIVNVGMVLIPFAAGNGAPSEPAALHAADLRYTMTWLIIAFFGTGVLVAARRRTEGAVGAIGATLLMMLYLGILPQFLLRLRVFGPPGAAWLLLYSVAAVKLCDIGAFFTGAALGRTKLIEWLSPKKTIEGLAGGVALSVLFAVSIPMLVARFASTGSAMPAAFPETGRAVVFGAVMALAGQAGDLLESLIKRDARAKDSAAVIPAFGGVLDILDSLLVTAPLAYWILLQ